MNSTSDHYVDIPPIDVSHCVKVTVVAGPMEHDSPPLTRRSRFSTESDSGEMEKLQRRTKDFTETGIKGFAEFLEQVMVESTGLVLV